jgi:hypothetical protein
MPTDVKELVIPHWKLVGIDEGRHWNLPPEVMAKITKIFGVYLFDAKRHVHCCEFTPSYELYPLGTEVIFVDGVTEQEREDIWEMLRDGDRDCSNVTYMHVHEVDSAIETKKFMLHDFGPDDPDWWRRYLGVHDGNEVEAWEDARESMIDHCRSNSYL